MICNKSVLTTRGQHVHNLSTICLLYNKCIGFSVCFICSGLSLKCAWINAKERLSYLNLRSIVVLLPQKWYFERFFSSLSWLLLFDFSSSFFFRFSLFFFCWEFRRLYFGGKIFRKAFRILGLDEKKGRWVVEQDFHGNFLVNITLFFVFSTLCVTELSLFWYGLKDLFTLHKSAVKVVLDH